MSKLLKSIVIVMIVAFVLDVASLILNVVWPSAVESIALCIFLPIRFLIIRGLIRRTPAAWTWARIFSLLGIVLTLFKIFLISLISVKHVLAYMILDILPFSFSVFVFVGLGRPSVRCCFSRGYDRIGKSNPEAGEEQL